MILPLVHQPELEMTEPQSKLQVVLGLVELMELEGCSGFVDSGLLVLEEFVELQESVVHWECLGLVMR